MADGHTSVDDTASHNANNPCDKKLEDGLGEDYLVNHLEISVTEAEKRASGALNLRDFYTVYLIETKVTDNNWIQELSNSCQLWRRYSEFEVLRAYLEATYPYIVVPPLPEKRALYTWQKVSTDTLDPDFIDRRRAGLENFLLRVASHHILSRDKIFLGFLQQEEGWRDSVNDTGYWQQTDSKLKALNASMRLRKSDKQFEEIKNYGNELQSNLNNLLKIRVKLVERLYGIHKIHSNYGRVFSEWSAIEKEMGDGLQKAGHFMDSFSSSVDTLLEEEEVYADQLKEYFFYAGVLQNICRKQEMLQYGLERADEALAAKSQQREKVLQGKMSLMSRLLGSVDTDEVREMKVAALDQEIDECEEQIKTTSEDVSKFGDSALTDIKRFQEQKVHDLRETLMNFVILQIKTCKKGLQTWTNIRDCLESIP